MLAVAVEKVDPLRESRRQAGDRGKALAGKCTLNRLELSGARRPMATERYKKIVMDEDRIGGLDGRCVSSRPRHGTGRDCSGHGRDR